MKKPTADEIARNVRDIAASRGMKDRASIDAYSVGWMSAEIVHLNERIETLERRLYEKQLKTGIPDFLKRQAE